MSYATHLLNHSRKLRNIPSYTLGRNDSAILVCWFSNDRSSSSSIDQRGMINPTSTINRFNHSCRSEHLDIFKASLFGGLKGQFSRTVTTRMSISVADSVFKNGSRSCFSSSGNKDGDDGNKSPASSSSSWRFSAADGQEDDEGLIFGNGDGDGDLSGITDSNNEVFGDGESIPSAAGGAEASDESSSWLKDSSEKSDIFGEIDKEFGLKKDDGGDEWATTEGYVPWNFVDESKEEVFDIGGENVEGLSGVGDGDDEKLEMGERREEEEDKQLDQEKQQLSVQLKGPNRAFGDLIAASGITEAMLDSLIALKDFEGVEGLPPLREIEDLRLEKNERKSTMSEIERKKQEEAAKARVRQVDEKGRAYGTGRRKCSIARVWVQPGDGKFIVNDKQFDVYFPMLDQRADLLRPFSETKTLGLWDVNCTVKGGGISGQVGAIRLGISRALENWEPDLRPHLRSAGFLTRDPRVVERKKPGKAKARKSFQWVKR